jgi:hypothetical protein
MLIVMALGKLLINVDYRLIQVFKSMLFYINYKHNKILQSRLCSSLRLVLTKDNISKKAATYLLPLHHELW